MSKPLRWLKFQLWNLAGFLTEWAGSVLYGLSLSVGRWSDRLNAKADSYR